MTNGTSQGLYVIIAVVIFGIFVGISYLIFQDSLRPKLTSIFETGTNMPVHFYLPNLPEKKEFAGELEYTKTNIDLSKLGDNYPKDTVYKISFDIHKEKDGGTNVIYTQNGSSQKYNLCDFYTKDRCDYQPIIQGLNKGWNNQVTFLFRLERTDQPDGKTEGKSMLSFYGIYDSGNKLKIRNIDIEIYNGEGDK